MAQRFSATWGEPCALVVTRNMRLFQVQTVHFDEIKKPRVGPLFCKIEALYLKTLRFQLKKLIEKVPSFNLIYDTFL